MKANASKLDAFHKKAPFVEIILTLLFGAFVDRFLNKFFEETLKYKWFQCSSLYVLLAVIIIIILYYSFFSSVRVHHSSRLEQKEEDMLTTLYAEGIKLLGDENRTIEEKAETCKIIMEVRRG